MNNTLYVVCGSRNLKNAIVSFANVGMTFNGRAVRDRLKDPDYSHKAAGGEWVVICEHGIGGYTDRDVHKILEKRYPRNPEETSNTEEFRFDLSPDEINKVVSECVHELIHGVSRPKAYPPRPEQKRCVSKCIEYFNSGGTEFLVNAKMRFGKCFTVFKIVEQMRVQRFVVATGRPGVFDSWKKDILDHVDFDGWGIKHYGNGGEDIPAKDGKPTMELVSLQWLDYDPNRLSAFVDSELLVLDESHYGTETDLAREKFDNIKAKRVIHLSGTDFRKLNGGLFLKENTYTWSYADEQSAKKADRELPIPTGMYESLPDLHLYTIRLDSNADKLLEQFSDEEQFHMSKLFAVQDGEFVDQMAVRRLFELLRHTGKRNISPWMSKKIKDTNSLDHLLVFLPTIESVTALGKLLPTINFWEDFEVLMATGDEANADSSSEIDKRVRDAQRLGKRSITLTVERFKEGVTVPFWGSVFMMNNWSSPISYWQAAFRAQTSCEERNKKVCYVFDFNPERALKCNYEYSSYLHSMKEDADERTPKDFFDSVPVLSMDGNLWRGQDLYDRAKELSYKEKNYIERIGSAGNVIVEGKNLEEFFSKFSSLSKNSTHNATPVIEVINDNGTQLGKVQKSGEDVRSANSGSPCNKNELNKRKREAIEKVQNVLRKLPTFMFQSTEKNFYSCADIIKHVRPVKERKEIFESITGVSVDDFDFMSQRYFVKDSVDRCLRDYTDHLVSISGNSDETVDLTEQDFQNLERAMSQLTGADEQTQTPIEVVRNMVNKTPAFIWSNTEARVCDPFCGRGVFLLECFRRFYFELKSYIPNHQDRVEHILSVSIHGSDIDRSMILKTNAAFSRLLKRINLDDLPHNLDIKDYLKEDSVNMKYDVIIGNPPYKAGMHLDFYKKAMADIKEDGHVIMIHPADYVVVRRRSRKHSEKYSPFKSELDKRSVSITFVDNPFGKNADMIVPLAITHSYPKGCGVRFKDERSRYFKCLPRTPDSAHRQYKSVNEISQWGDGVVLDSIVLKTNTTSTMKDFLAEKRGDYYVSMSLLTCNGKLSVVGYDGKEVITEMMFNIVNERANCILDKPQVAKPQQGKTKGSEKPWISFPTEKEATNFLHFITRNKTFRAIYIIQKHDQNAANNMLGFLPWLDWSEEWTDDRTYKHFGFTDKEIACIENITKLVNLA